MCIIFVDTQPYEDVKKNPYKSASKDPTKALTEVINEHFPHLRKFIKDYVHKNEVCTSHNQVMKY